MPNWAVVIGVDRYSAAPHLNLKGAVRDALGVAQFLTGGEPPLVELSRLTLLVSPTPSSPKPSGPLSRVTLDQATRSTIGDAVTDVAGKQADGGRLFVHFSGHGLVGPGLNGGEAILPSDYRPSDPGISISLQGIRDFLRTSLFNEQFFFIDACRNTPMPESFNIGQFPVTPAPEQMRPAVQQFVFCATLRGVKAHEDRRVVNDERGVFSEPLLRGLHGERDAKTFDEKKQVYLVTVNRLLSFLRVEVEKTVDELKLPPLPDGTRPQEPRLLGDMASTEAVVVPMAPSAVAPISLTFAIVPPEAAPSTAVVVRRETDIVVGPPISGSTAIALPPRDYRVVATADGFRPLKPSWPVEPYADTQLMIEFERERPGFTFGEESAPVSPLPSSIDFRSSDPSTIVRLRGSHGQVITTARERVVVGDLSHGSYRGQILLSDGSVIEQAIEVDDGEDVRVIGDAPSRQRPSVLATLVLTEYDPERRPTTVTLHEEAVGVRGERIKRGVVEVLMSLPVLPGWFTRLEVVRVPEMPPSATVVFESPDGVEIDQADRLISAQRYYQNGLFDAALELARHDLGNPIGALIDAYSWLRITLMAQAGAMLPGSVAFYLDHLHDRAARLAELYPGSSDVVLIEAELALMLHETDVAVARIDTALQFGVPMFAFGAQRLAAHVRVLQIDHPQRRLLEQAVSRRIAGWFLTAWLGSQW